MPDVTPLLQRRERILATYCRTGKCGTFPATPRGNAPMSTIHSIDDAAVAALNEELASLDLEGHWQLSGNVLANEPRPVVPAHLWHWADIRRLLLRAGEIRALDGGGGRRTVRLCLPGLEQKWATRTIHASFQLVKPGETAQAHRHSLAALRFVVEGSGGHTTVEGEKFIMEPGDLVLTPQYTWHDHGNESDGTMIWIDATTVRSRSPSTPCSSSVFRRPRSPSGTMTTSPGDAPARCGRAASKGGRAVIHTSTNGAMHRMCLRRWSPRNGIRMKDSWSTISIP
jgi:mannose-6-phosphate isomerase-like protein (cupin superfamily)